MSLRTKLLAAIVGLNGVILLLALYLLLRDEPGSTEGPSSHAVADLVALGGVLGGEPKQALAKPVSKLLEEMEAAAVFRDVVVVEDKPVQPFDPGGSPELERHLWTLQEYLSSPRGEELPVGAARQQAEDLFMQARRNPRLQSVEGDRLSVVLPLSHGDEVGRRGLVARYVAPRPQRTGVRGVYVVMVVGVIVLTGVFFWLVSRLVVRPLASLTDAADRIARGDFRIQVARRGTNDEFDRTMAAFNRMAREIGEYQGHLEDRVLGALQRMKKAEQHLAIAQRLAATGKLASGVAHEINNPLGGMKNAIRALSRGDLTPEKTREYLDLIGEGLARVEETVKKFLSFTPRRVEPRPTDLAEIARKAADLARHRLERAGVRLEESLPEPGTAVVFGDPHELQQVALNLLLNAADAVASKGEGGVTLRVARRREESILEVQDEGVGLTPEDQDRCFDMFFTTKDVGEGSGLGLAVAHTIVTNHGGRIEVESRPGEGATFRVVLPGEPQTAASVEGL